MVSSRGGTQDCVTTWIPSGSPFPRPARAFSRSDSILKRIISLFAATFLLTACPGGDDGGSAAPMCPEPETIPSNITTLVEIGVECRNVEAPNGVSVRNGGTLKIAPGTTVSFASGAGLQIDEGGIIEAIGSADAPITLKGREDVPGFWKGLILYRAASTQNQLAHVIIES